MKTIYIVGLILILSACGEREKAWRDSTDKLHHVIVYSESGGVIREWDSKDSVIVDGSGGYEFVDSETGKFVQISGTVVVTTL